MDVKNEVEVMKYSIKTILTELKKLNGLTVVDPLQVKKTKNKEMIMVEVRVAKMKLIHWLPKWVASSRWK